MLWWNTIDIDDDLLVLHSKPQLLTIRVEYIILYIYIIYIEYRWYDDDNRLDKSQLISANCQLIEITSELRSKLYSMNITYKLLRNLLWKRDVVI